MSMQKSISEFDHNKPNRIAYEDIPRICASLALFGAAFGFGACLGVLGPSLPEMSEQLGIEVSTTGQVFSWRGIGGLGGTFIAAWAAERPVPGLPKHFMVVLAILFSGAVTFLVPLISPLGNKAAFNTIKFLYLLQGIGFGILDTVAIVSMQEMWGQRVQPWMQMKKLMSSAGAVVGPVCVSKFGYSLAFKISAGMGLTSLLGVALEALYMFWDRTQDFGEDFVAPELETLAANLEAIQEELDTVEGNAMLGSIDMGSVVSGSEFQEYSRVLSFATPQIVELLEQPVPQIFDVHIVPRHVSLTIAAFSFFHIGLYYTFGGWISAYTLMVDPSVSFSDAAQMASLYSTSMCVSAVYAIFASLFFSITTVLRFQLFILLMGALVLYVPMDPATSNSASSILMGLAVSCIYPLIMTMANDYEMTMDARGVSLIVLGGGIGEALAPAAIGVLIGIFGSSVFPLSVATTAIIMILAYVYVHVSLTSHQKQLLHPMLTEDRVGLLNDSIDDETRPRSRSRITRGWRSLSVEKYTGTIGLEMIVEGQFLPSIQEDVPLDGTNHLSYQNGNSDS